MEFSDGDEHLEHGPAVVRFRAVMATRKKVSIERAPAALERARVAMVAATID